MDEERGIRTRGSDAGVQQGLTVDRLCDEVLQVADLTLASCPRAQLLAAPVPDPFRRPLTIHPTGLGRWSARHCTDDQALLDFDMLQTPHGQSDAVPDTNGCPWVTSGRHMHTLHAEHTASVPRYPPNVRRPTGFRSGRRIPGETHPV